MLNQAEIRQVLDTPLIAAGFAKSGTNKWRRHENWATWHFCLRSVPGRRLFHLDLGLDIYAVTDIRADVPDECPIIIYPQSIPRGSSPPIGHVLNGQAPFTDEERREFLAEHCQRIRAFADRLDSLAKVALAVQCGELDASFIRADAREFLLGQEPPGAANPR